MIPKKCTQCGDMTTESLTWAVWAWNDANGDRHAYRHKVCLTCVSTTIAPLYVKCETYEGTCPNCGIDVTGDMDPVYCTFVPRGMGKCTIEAPTCPPCAAMLRSRIVENGEPLENRLGRGLEQSSSPYPEPSTIWASLGIVPRDRT